MKLFAWLGIIGVVLSTFFLHGCKSNSSGAPAAKTPRLVAVERRAPSPNDWQGASANAAGVFVVFPLPANVATGPTVAVLFTGPMIPSDYEVSVDGALAASGGGFDAATKQQAAEAAGKAWYVFDGGRLDSAGNATYRIEIRLPNSTLAARSLAKVEIVNVSQNPGLTGASKRSAPLVVEVGSAQSGSLPTPTPTPTQAPTPQLSGVSPLPLVPGAVATLTGTGFSADCTTNRIMIDGCLSVVPTACSATSITFVVPNPLPVSVDLRLTTNGRTFTRANVPVRRIAGAFSEVTVGRALSQINRGDPAGRYDVSTSVVFGRFETVVSERVTSGTPRRATMDWVQAAAVPSAAASDLAGVGVSSGGQSVLVVSHDEQRVSGGKKVAKVVYTAPCSWNVFSFPMDEFTTTLTNAPVLIVPRFFFSPDGSILAIARLTSNPNSGYTEVYFVSCATGSIIGIEPITRIDSSFSVRVEADGANDRLRITGERASPGFPSDVRTTLLSLPR